MTRTLVHCLQGTLSRQHLIEQIIAHGLTYELPNDHAIEIITDTTHLAQHDQLLAVLQDEYVIFHDHDDPRSGRGRFQTHVRINNESSSIHFETIKPTFIAPMISNVDVSAPTTQQPEHAQDESDHNEPDHNEPDHKHHGHKHHGHKHKTHGHKHHDHDHKHKNHGHKHHDHGREQDPSIFTEVPSETYASLPNFSTFPNSSPFPRQLIINRATSQGNTTTTMAQYYKFPIQFGVAPTIGIISLGGTYLTADLTAYWKTTLGLPQIPSVSYVDVDGVKNAPNQAIKSGDGSDENTLDLEIAGGICPGAKLVIYFGPNTEKGFYDTFNYAIHDTIHKPKLISCSWGAPEADFTPTSIMLAYDQLFASATQVICTAAGDNGASDGISDGHPHVDFPASSPHVVACGGTTIVTSSESTWSWNAKYQWGTGGGISGYFAQPSFQAGIAKYPTGSVIRRALPDVSLNADPLSGWTIYYNKQLYVNQFGGTSCVAPAIAGMLGLFNSTYPLGFLYHAYKSNPKGFKDITSGTNDNIAKTTGLYNAGTGYDLCTGLGSVNGTQLYLLLK